MKNKIILKSILGIVGVATIATPIVLNLTSCNNNPQPVPPGPGPSPEPTPTPVDPTKKTEFYFVSEQDYTGKDVDFDKFSQYKVNTKDDALAILSDSSKYTDQMILWDIINCYVYSYFDKPTDSLVERVDGCITDFVRNKNYVQYKVNLKVTMNNSNETVDVTYYTTNTKDGNFEPVEITNEWLWLGTKDEDAYSLYSLNINTGTVTNASLCKSKFIWKA